MAILVAAGGAVLGSAIGIGSSAGWLIGSVVGSLLFPKSGPDVVTEGPRLGDLTVTGSAYGAPIAIGYGTLRMAGNMIWSAGIREQRNVQRTRTGGKDGGGSSQTAITYSYFASFALAFGEGPADDVLRLWADGKLIYDKTSLNEAVGKASLRFRFHAGTETQAADPLIEAHVGAGQAPAHRGLVTIVFEDLPLADFGNRIPNITAEITFRRADQLPYQLIDLIRTAEGGAFAAYQIDDLAVDWTRGTGYFVQSSSDPAQCGIRRFDLRTMREDRQVRMTEVSPGGANEFPMSLLCGPDGHLYLTVDGGNSSPLIRVDPNALIEVARFGSSSSGLSNTTSRFVRTSFLGAISAYGARERVDFLLTGSLFNDVGLLRADTMTYVWGESRTIDEARVRGCIGGRSGADFGEGWVLGSGFSTSHGQLGLYRLRVAATAAYEAALDQTLGVTFEKVAAFSPDDIESGATAFYDTAGGLTYDATDDGVIFQIRISNGGSAGTIYTVKWRADLGIVWKTPTPIQINYEGPFFGQSRIVRQRWTVMRYRRVIQIDTATGALVYDVTWPEPVGESGAQIYDAITDTLLVHGKDGWALLFLNRGSGEGETLSGIVADLCDRADLGLADIDVAELTDTVPGYVIGRQSTVRAAIEPLAGAYAFDGVESDDVLAFRKRGRTPVATLGQSDLVALDDTTQEAWRERRTQEVELPERVSVVYMDRDGDYRQGAQHAKRAARPVPTMASRHQTSVDLPLVLDATTAKRIAETTLYRAWIERAAYEGRTTWSWARLEPTDVVDVALDDGTVFRSRIVRTDMGADLAIALKAVAEDAAAYASMVTADGGAGVPVQVIRALAGTKLILLDVPLLREVDDLGGSGSRLYALMGGYGAPAWPGATLYKSADGSSWSTVAATMEEAAWGAAANALGTPASPFATDEDNALTVFMTTGAELLESVTQLEMLNGANPAALVKANGEVEILQYRDVTLNANGSFTLTGLLRGRRGTEVFTNGHAAGDLFVLLDPQDVEPLTQPVGEIGLARSWKAVGSGALFEDAETVVATATGRDLMPYAPVHIAGSRDADGSLTLTWQRRTRIGGDWRDGTGAVPLGETAEAYEVDILDGPGGAVVRTLTGLTAPSAVYAAADQEADFGAVQPLVHVAVHQLSTVIGRGFPGRAAL